MLQLLATPKGQLACAITVVGALLGGAAAVQTFGQTDPRDAFNCPSDRPAPAHTVLLLDATDALDAGQASRLMDAAQAEAKALPRRGRLTLLLVKANSPWEPEEVLSICNPGRGSEANPILETDRVLEREWKRAFWQPLQTAAAQLTQLPPTDESPILQSLAAVAGRRDFSPTSPGRKLVYVGDGLHYTAGSYSHYDGGDLQAGYRKSGIVAELDADFTGARIEIEYLRRPVAPGIQGASHRAFWRWWFTEHNASSVTFRGG